MILTVISLIWNKWIIGTGVIVLIILGLLLLLYLFQDRLIFFPQSMTEEEADRITEDYEHAEEVSFEMEDGTQLYGWLVHPESSQQESEGLLIYYGGNAEELSGQIPYMSQHLPDWTVLLVNYRGYGRSEGSPAEEVLYRDASAVYDEIHEQLEAPSTVLMGRSIGTAVAIHTAAEREADKVILISPFDSMEEVAGTHYPFLPVSQLLRYPFDSTEKINQIDAPLLAIAGDNDQVIPQERTDTLLAQRKGEYRYEVMENMGHNDVHLAPDFWNSIHEFLEE